ncbi:Aspartyl aminopeptidase [Pseudocercospora fuligena]|uniref:aspartyl aminopeptidase n=1 Tax=Pseudocercospora fuligena TaxID=685502 RepID=A0A8H6RSG0_9PEZI|nr:Aspartyl aminopeptidase [Pseudocercospora fuligena]
MLLGLKLRPVVGECSAVQTWLVRNRALSTMTNQRANDFISFLNASPSPFFAVRSSIERLEKAGFKPIKERDSWNQTLQPGGKYYLTRNASTIVAFAIGHKWKPGNPVAMVGAHTDSPCLRIKPVSKRSADGFLQVGVELYGGGMWHTWFDRDLGVAGRVMVKSKEGVVEQRLVRISKPVCRIPNLAVHFGQPFEPYNKETQLFPVLGLVTAELNRQGKSAEEIKKEEAEKQKSAGFQPLKSTVQRHHPYLVELIAKEAGCEAEHVEDFELVLYDTQPACLGGINEEFIYSARLDNLGMTYCAVEGLIQSLKDDTALKGDSTIRLIACFDHEEIGSQSAQGADSNMLPSVIRRLSCLPPSSDDSEKSYDKVNGDANVDNSTAYEQTLSTSFLISADMAHSVNPNYGGSYESEHRPHMNEGTVIKINANVRYATNSPGIVLLQECARRAKAASWQLPEAKTAEGGVPLQLFVVRNDFRCGSTIGPMLSAALGARTIDVGNPQLSMHSIRETGGAYDPEHGVNLFDSFFEHYGELESRIMVD